MNWFSGSLGTDRSAPAVHDPLSDSNRDSRDHISGLSRKAELLVDHKLVILGSISQ